jgi:tetratricopeptide (TPR) repeat protein
MSRDIVLDDIELSVSLNEFEQYTHPVYNHLKLYRHLGEYERMCGLIIDICKELNIKNVVCESLTHDRFISKYLDKYTKLNILETKDANNRNLIIYDLNPNEVVPKIELTNDIVMIMRFGSLSQLKGAYSISVEGIGKIPNTKQRISCIIRSKLFTKEWVKSSWFNTDKGVINYDNLINMCIMVKNAGPQFIEMLNHNKSLGDKWTIMDTGSTDGTLETIKEFLKDKMHPQLVETPFKDFKYNRNKCLDLAGTRCKYTLMLDDTYRITDCVKLREFLDVVRDDIYASSYSMYIVSDDVQYTTNRIVKTLNKLRYVFKIHEVISDKDNNNVIIPPEISKIEDGRYDYMEERTMKRKELDMRLLFEELEEDPNNPRTYYYIAQTYNLLKDYDNAYKYFKIRGDFINSGFIQERIDALFEAGRLANFQLNKSWEECLELYNRAYELDKSRPEVPYFIGIHYYMQNDFKGAYPHFKLAFSLGFPEHCQYGLKPTLSFYFLPKMLASICYENKDYMLGLNACNQFLSLLNLPKPTSSSVLVTQEDYDVVVSWKNIYHNLIQFENAENNVDLYFENNGKPLFVFMADGGFSSWTGSDIESKGVGGSETFIIEFAKYIKECNVIVCCKCETSSMYKGVWYVPLITYHSLCKHNYIKYCMISRYSEYIPVALKGNCENVFFIMHDLGPSGVVIPVEPKLKQIFCLTPWHCELFNNKFPSLKHLTSPLGYGINKDIFDSLVPTPNKSQNIQFIYSSFPNRGLLQLLEMWSDILRLRNDVELHIYADVDGKWVNSVASGDMEKIRSILHKGLKGVIYHGWVDKKTLAQGWKDADIWLYPCTFQETFCLTAYECALSKTLAITNGLAALGNTVADRGICVEGDPTTSEWKNKTLLLLSVVLNNLSSYQSLVETNYDYVITKSWESQALAFYDTYCKPLWRESRDKSPLYFSYIEFDNIIFDKQNKKNVYIIGDCTGSMSSILMESYGQYINYIMIVNCVDKDLQAFKNNTSPCYRFVQYKKTDDIYNSIISYIQSIDVIYIDSNILNMYELYSILMLSMVVIQKGGYVVINNINDAVNAFIQKNKCNSIINNGIVLLKKN